MKAEDREEWRHVVKKAEAVAPTRRRKECVVLLLYQFYTHYHIAINIRYIYIMLETVLLKICYLERCLFITISMSHPLT
jgi:hypothetical protein